MRTLTPILKELKEMFGKEIKSLAGLAKAKIEYANKNLEKQLVNVLAG